MEEGETEEMEEKEGESGEEEEEGKRAINYQVTLNDQMWISNNRNEYW